MKLRGKRGQSRVAEKTPGTRKREWVTKMTKDAPKTVILDQPSPPPWTTIDEVQKRQRTAQVTTQNQRDGIIKKYFENQWINKWKAYQAKHMLYPTIAQQAPIHRKRLNAHKLLDKAQSSLATQIRTEKIGLANFLYRRKVPGVNSAACPCGSLLQTAKHVIMFCRLHEHRTHMLRTAGS